MKSKLLLLALLFGLSMNKMYGQDKAYQFGKINQAELSSTSCPIDSTADAYVICNVGSTHFDYNDTKGHFCIVFDRHVRIKILRKSAFDLATVLIPLFKNSNGEEQVDVLKGNTYNLEN